MIIVYTMDIDIQKSFAESYTFFDDYKRGGYSISNIIKSQTQTGGAIGDHFERYQHLSVPIPLVLGGEPTDEETLSDMYDEEVICESEEDYDDVINKEIYDIFLSNKFPTFPHNKTQKKINVSLRKTRKNEA